jgi:hypothetical protein
MEPGGNPVAAPDRVGSVDQDQERRLERVIGGGGVGQDPAADTQDQRTMPGDEPLKRCLVASDREPFEKLAVAEPGDRPALEHATDFAPARSETATRHSRAPETPNHPPDNHLTRAEGSMSWSFWDFRAERRFERAQESEMVREDDGRTGSIRSEIGFVWETPGEFGFVWEKDWYIFSRLDSNDADCPKSDWLRFFPHCSGRIGFGIGSHLRRGASSG